MQRNHFCTFLIATGILCISGHRYVVEKSNIAVNGVGAMSDSAERVDSGVDSGALLNQLSAYNEVLKQQVEDLKVQLRESQQQEAELMSQAEEEEEQAEAADLELDENEEDLALDEDEVEEADEEADEGEEVEVEQDEDQEQLDLEEDLAAIEDDDAQASLMQEDEEVDEEAYESTGMTPCQKFCVKNADNCNNLDATAQFKKGSAPPMEVVEDAPKYHFHMKNDGKLKINFFHDTGKKHQGHPGDVGFEAAGAKAPKVPAGSKVTAVARPVTGLVNGQKMTFLPLWKKLTDRAANTGFSGAHNGYVYTYTAIEVTKLAKKHRVVCKPLSFINKKRKYPNSNTACQPWNQGRKGAKRAQCY